MKREQVMLKRVLNVYMSVLILIAILVGPFAMPSFGAPAKSDSQGSQYGVIKQELDAYFSQLTQAGTFNGSVLVARDGRVILKKGYGKADFANDRANTPETVFSIASLTKSFVAVSIMMLEERGQLSVNDPVGKYVPEYVNGDQVTIHQLLNQTSGTFLYLNDFSSPIWLDFGNFSKQHTPEDVLNYFVDRPLYFAPGSQWQYCNSGYILLGVIVERVSGMSFGDFIEANITRPLNMTHTAYDQFGNAFSNLRAVDYDSVLPLAPTWFYVHPSLLFTVGGMVSTVKDMYKWDRALSSQQLVSRETLKRVFTPSTPMGQPAYGYGWLSAGVRDDNGDAKRHQWHPGILPGTHGIHSRFVDDGISVIILENLGAPPVYSSDFGDFDLKTIAEDVAGMVRAAK